MLKDVARSLKKSGAEIMSRKPRRDLAEIWDSSCREPKNPCRNMSRKFCGDFAEMWEEPCGEMLEGSWLRERFLTAALLRSPTDPERPWLEILHDLT